jgi:phosphopentomutase
MPQLDTIKTSKTASYVDRGYNYSKKQKLLEQEEKEIARLEAQQRGETLEEETEESDSEGAETTQVHQEGGSQQEEADSEVEAQEDDSELNAEERSFKKRYGDLRRHMQQKEKEWQERLEALEGRAKTSNIIPPKSDEDIEKWAKKYPDVAGIVETIAAKKAQELFKNAEMRFAEFDKVQDEVARTKAENQIRETHPDFDKLRASDDFHDWAEKQPKWVQDALYENADDPASVVRVIDLYKVDKGLNTAAKKQTAKEAASVVTRKSAKASIDPDDSSNYIKESQVAKMSAEEFEKRSDEINQAIRSGKFVYDISGRAR